ncbi:hypothetical protein GYMLUDRAFT_167501 [Collybiopsis luxurians FD-317 M1]|uniref:Uncharacterized protein n=1 Tax=Collybiopsis luxurians FD-317 M1 TaxID=944289 RepID=A0A0D0BAD4_9AGAR|nr:hypothetical protein GYMLUDRAFT_167501 [Collybiopsis luxurians FD-317 M1]
MYPLRFPQDAKGIQWFENAFEFLNINLGGPYTAFVNRWSDLEQINGWKTRNSGLSKTNHPGELTTWIQYGRNKKKIVIAPGQVGKFAEEFWSWWIHLQPEWRKKGKDGLPLPVQEFEDNWKSLDHYGTNGWLSILACLRWWGESLSLTEDSEKKERVADWVSAIEDVSKMLEGLISYKQKLT